jgi:hypothetical protein
MIFLGKSSLPWGKVAFNVAKIQQIGQISKSESRKCVKVERFFHLSWFVFHFFFVPLHPLFGVTAGS